MTQITEDSSVQIRNPVANRADFDGHKKKGTFGWATDQAAPVFCPADDANYTRLSVHPDDAPAAGTLNSGDTILVSVGGTLKKTTVLAIGGGGTWQPLDSDLTAIAALATQAFGRSLLTQADAAAVRTLIGAPSAADLSGYQPLDSDLTAIAGLATQAFGRSLLTQADAAAVRTLIGAGTSSFNGAYTSLSAIPAPIAALDDLTPAADRLPYFTGASAAGLATFTAFARTLLDDTTAAAARTTLGAGTVSSVALSLPTIFSVSGSPITGSGTLTATLASQTADKVFASPSGSAGAPAFISLAASHIPNLPWSKITSGLPTTLAGYGITDAQLLDSDLTALAALSGTGVARRTGPGTWDQVTLTGWATKAYTNGSTTDVAEGTNLYYTDARARAAFSGSAPISVSGAGVVSHSTADGYHHVPATGTTNNGKFLKAGATAGTESWQTLVVGDLPSHGSTHEFGGADPIVGQNLPGLRISDTPVWRSLDLIRALGSTIDGATKIRLLNNDSSYGGALWTDSGANMRMAFLQNDATWTDRYTFGRNGNLNILSGTLQLGGVDTITATREGRFTGLRLTNLSAGQIPVASDANGQITASGLTDDGTYFTSNRIFRSHNSLTKSGNTWTALQWSQGTTIRTTMLSSDGSGAGACHALTMVPASTETANEDLGFLLFGQRLSGKSGTNPGLKLAASGRAVGSGGSTGGFGGQLRFEYRPDNGANLVDALRIGAFGGSTADAVEAAILLRITAGAQVPAITSKILKTSSDGTLQGATANTDYLPVNNPTSTGVLGADVTKHTVRTYVGGARTIDPGLTPKFQKQTGTGTITLPAASASYEGLEYKITFHGRFSVTFNTPSGTIYTLAAGASYWYDVASTTVSAGDASGENCSCDLWCDGSNWYIRW